MQMLLEDVRDLEPDYCFLVFAPWVQALEKASKALDSIGVSNRVMHAGLHIDERNRLVDQLFRLLWAIWA
jgi:hypothetical protein